MWKKDVKTSANVSAICFGCGMIGTGLSIAAGSTLGVMLCYGVLMGIGLGIGYLTPVKTLMMWFAKHKGLATGIAITGFGLAKVIASPIITYLLSRFTIAHTFYILGGAYFFLMCIGSMLLKKPERFNSLKGASFSIKDSLKFILNKQYLAIWFVFFINITCGLALISQEKTILTIGGLGSSVAVIASCTAALNAIGRFGYSTLSDRINDRASVYLLILFTSTLVLSWNWLVFNSIFVLVSILLVCNAGYGGGFSVLPSLLSDKFGMQNVSVIHGFALSAWAWAGLIGNHMGHFLLTTYGINVLFFVLILLYGVAAIVTNKYILDK